MSEAARVALAVVCFVVSGSAQVTALLLLAAEGRRVRNALRLWRDAPDSPAELHRVVEYLLTNRFDRMSAVVLLVVGVVAGALGGLLGLWSGR